MTECGKTRKYSMMAAVCCLAWYILDGWLSLKDVGASGVNGKVLWAWAIMATIIMLLLINKRNIGIVFAFTARTVTTGYNVFQFYKKVGQLGGELVHPEWVVVRQFGGMLAMAGLLIEAIACFKVKSQTKKSAIVWTIPACFEMASVLASHMLVREAELLISKQLLVLRITRDCFEVASIFLIGMWLKGLSEVERTENEKANFEEKRILGGAERLSVCKELLDRGIITQEEFEKKKEEILR